MPKREAIDTNLIVFCMSKLIGEKKLYHKKDYRDKVRLYVCFME